MDVTRINITICIICIILLTCKDGKKKNQQTTEIAVAYFYFDSANNKKCAIKKNGLAYLKELEGDSISQPYFIKRKKDKKIIYEYCNYGRFLFDSSFDKEENIFDVDTINLITPKSEKDLLKSLKKENFIVEKLNDTVWSKKKVHFIKKKDNVKT